MLGWCSVTQVCPTVWPQGPSPARPLCLWDFPSKNTGVDCHFLLQRTLLTQKSNLSFPCLLHWQVDSLPLSHLGSLLHVNMGPLTGISIPTGLQMPFSGRRVWKLHLSCKKEFYRFSSKKVIDSVSLWPTCLPPHRWANNSHLCESSAMESPRVCKVVRCIGIITVQSFHKDLILANLYLYAYYIYKFTYATLLLPWGSIYIQL